MKILAIILSLLSLSIIGASTRSSLAESKSASTADSHIVYMPIVTKFIREYATPAATNLMALYNSTNGLNWKENAG